MDIRNYVRGKTSNRQ